MANVANFYQYPPRGMLIDEAARYVGVDPAKFGEMVASGRMPKPKLIDRRPVWDRLALDAAFASLPDQSEGKGAPKAVSLNPEVYSPKTLAARWQCSERHVRNLIARGELPAWKLGDSLMRINLEDVEKFENGDGSAK